MLHVVDLLVEFHRFAIGDRDCISHRTTLLLFTGHSLYVLGQNCMFKAGLGLECGVIPPMGERVIAVETKDV